jgi:hypothetical protein
MGFWCQQSWINFFWSGYDFHSWDWPNSFGLNDACNLTLPLGRTFNSIVVLHYAMPVDPTSTGDFSGNILHWGGNYALREIDELDATCATGSPAAHTVWGPVIDNYTDLNQDFFYGMNVIERAGALVHEARHADYCGHNGNDGTNPCAEAIASCDESFNDGCSGVGSPTGQGANAFEVAWLWWFTVEADAGYGTTSHKELARDMANAILDGRFDVRPCFNITTTGQIVTTC